MLSIVRVSGVTPGKREKLAIRRPHLVDVAADLRRILRDLGVRLGTENIGVHERKMRHIEKILDDAKTGGLHRDRPAYDDAAIGLVRFRNR